MLVARRVVAWICATASMLLSVALAGACGARAAPPTVPPLSNRARPALPTTKVDPAWRVPAVVKRWTRDDTELLGPYPQALSQLTVGDAWFIEPAEALNDARLAMLIDDVATHAIAGLSLRGQTLAPGSIRGLRHGNGLRALELSDTGIADADLLVASLPASLRRIYLADTAITDRSAAFWAAHPELEVVDLSNTVIGDATIEALRSAPHLRALALAGTRISDGAATALASLRDLEVLDLGRTRIGKLVASAVGTLPLRELYLGQTDAAAAAAELASLAPSIIRLDLSAAPVRDSQLSWLPEAKKLQSLYLGDTDITDVTARGLSRLSTLRGLDLAGTATSAAVLTTLAALPVLEEIDLADTAADDTTARALLTRPSLRVLRLDGAAISNRGLRSAPAALRELYLSRTKISDDGLAALGPLHELTALGLGDTGLSDASAARISALGQLHTLVLDGVAFTSAGFAQLGALTGLERLLLERTSIDDEAIAALSELRQLRVLHLQDSNLADRGLEVMRGFVRLEELTLGDTQVTRAIDTLVAWPRLRSLSLYGLSIGDGALTKLAAMRQLRVVNLGATDIIDPAALATLPRLRSLGLAETHVSDRGLAGLAGAAQLVELSLAGCDLGPGTVASLLQLLALQRLDVRGTPLADPPATGPDPLLPLLRRGIVVQRSSSD